MELTSKVCDTCNVSKPIDQFRMRHRICRNCYNNFEKDKRARKKQLKIEIEKQKQLEIEKQIELGKEAQKIAKDAESRRIGIITTDMAIKDAITKEMKQNETTLFNTYAHKIAGDIVLHTNDSTYNDKIETILDENTYLYVITSSSFKDNLFKIGRHKGPLHKLIDRYKTYFTKLEVVRFVQIESGVAFHEKQIHNILKKYKDSGEWFNIEREQLLKMFDNYVNMINTDHYKQFKSCMVRMNLEIVHSTSIASHKQAFEQLNNAAKLFFSEFGNDPSELID